MKDGVVYVLEVNPRASRTIPFVSKATGVPWAQLAVQAMAGKSLPDLVPAWSRDLEERNGSPPIYHVKEVVLPWARFPGVDTLLGPEMRSTGEAMGSGSTFGEAFAKAMLGCHMDLPTSGSAFLSVNDNDKVNLIPIARTLAEMGFKLVATRGTARVLQDEGMEVTIIYKINEGHPNVVDYIKNSEVALIVNTPYGKASFMDERTIRRVALSRGVITVTTLTGAAAAVQAIRSLHNGGWSAQSLQERIEQMMNANSV
jgi:carbamoyl-phosphate synthase large subunit